MTDEHGPDAPSDKYAWERNTPIGFQTRQYLPTIAELIDRLTIVLLKQIFIPENKDAYAAERKMIEHDIDVCARQHGVILNPGEFCGCVAMLMLANRTIWENESEARKGGATQDKMLKFTHSINGVRNRAKNRIAKAMGERVDLKVDCLAADLPPEFGQWDVL